MKGWREGGMKKSKGVREGKWTDEGMVDSMDGCRDQEAGGGRWKDERIGGEEYGRKVIRRDGRKEQNA